MTLAQRIHDLRYLKGIGPYELCSKAGISRTALYQIELGRTKYPRAGTIQRIAAVLGVSVEELRNGVSQAPSAFADEMLAARDDRLEGRDGAYGELSLREFEPASQASAKTSDNGLAASYAKKRLPSSPELVGKLMDLLDSPFGEPVARVVEEAHKVMEAGRAARPYAI